MLKEAINIGKAKFQQKRTQVTNSGLLAVGFVQDYTYFKMGNLCIYLIEGYHYYQNKAAKLTKISNMYDVSKLVYGKTPYIAT